MEWLVDSKGKVTYMYAPVSVYQALGIVFYGVMMILYLLFSIILLLIVLIKFCFFWLKSPKAQDVIKKPFQLFSSSLDVFYINFYTIINFIFLLPSNGISYGIFMAEHWGEKFIKYQKLCMDILKIFNKYDDLFMIIAPIIQLLTTILFIKEFRETFICIITCGRCYSHGLEEDDNRWARKVKKKDAVTPTVKS
uniref:Serpentine receptor class gamma n=1 Tax=Parastrongyloides trichosuri TaxID=131310 RepID=A0A0N4ZQC0_PARTI